MFHQTPVTSDLLADVAARYGVHADAVYRLGSFENAMFAFERNDAAYVLRLAHSSHRSADQIHGEVDWINYLAERDVPCARAVPSLHGQVVEVVAAEDGYFSATAFVRAAGTHLNIRDYRPDVYRALGTTLGRIHRLTKAYEPPHRAWRRRRWSEDADLTRADRYLPADQTLVVQRLNDLIDYLHTLPTDRDSYGLVHEDAHPGNFFVHADGLTLFDFDDCMYTWFASDIAVALFYVALSPPAGMTQPDFAGRFLDAFFDGYNRENTLDPAWLRQIPTFLTLREIVLYIAIHRGFDLSKLDGWPARYMLGRRERIEAQQPFLEC